MFLNNVFAFILVAICVAGFIWISHRQKMILSELRELKLSFANDKEERRRIKCDGLFARLLRELYKLPNFEFRYERVSDTIMAITHQEITLQVAVYPDARSYEMGQFVAFGLPLGADHGCENKIKTFARGLKNITFHEMLTTPSLIAEYKRRREDPQWYLTD